MWKATDHTNQRFGRWLLRRGEVTSDGEAPAFPDGVEVSVRVSDRDVTTSVPMDPVLTAGSTDSGGVRAAGSRASPSSR